jgi:outer membrane protein assembly factor BamB
MTPTAGSVVFFGDMGGNFYAVDATDGQKLWGQKIGGAIGGGVITYTANGAQKNRRCDGSHQSPMANRNYHRRGVDTGTGYQ